MFTGLFTIGNGIVVLLVVLAIAGIYYFKKTSLIKAMLYKGVMEADEYFESSKGREKAKYVIELIRPSIPTLLRWLITDKMLLKAIDCILEELKEVFDTKEVNKKNIQKSAVNKFAEMAKNAKFEDDGSIIHNSQLDIINAELNSEIDEGHGELYGALKASTDLNGNDDIRAEIGVKYKF